ncbi:MAG TPA: homoserine O-acetyltransferase [Solirubrobacteraceae bacterium]|jgi:homoserine O-acetyltransferase|nr:homoserine O-acetyltransferase [Solirubrobacteraceae bacterium]
MSVGGIGRVETQRVVLFDEGDPLELDSGATLAPVEVAYETYGKLDADASNAVFVCHALSGDAHAAGHHGDPTRRGWWDTIIGPGRPLDSDRFFIICPNLLGGCGGSTGPASVEQRSGRAYGLRFPLFTVRDLVTVHRALLARLGISRLHAAVGGSLGGMQALQWALDRPQELKHAILVCASARLSAQNIALSAIARSAITSDPDFQGGDYLDGPRRPSHGLALARKLGHVTYLSDESMRRKFDRARRGGEGAPMTMDVDFEVEHYLEHQGEIFVERFDALSYLYLTRVMDYFDPFAEPQLDLERVDTQILAISFDSDWRFGSAHSRFIAEQLQAGGVSARHVELASPWGHDSFLLDGEQYHGLVADALGAPARAHIR